MKKTLILLAVLGLSLSVTAKPVEAKAETRKYYGRVGQLIVNALKAADVKPICATDGFCKYSISKFHSSTETDGCGGGTTGYDSQFTYADNSKYKFGGCEGEGHRITTKDKAIALYEIFSELDMDDSSGWTQFIMVEKAKCTTNAKYRQYANCEITTVPQPDEE